MHDDVPDSHPRAESLRMRHEVIEGWEKKVVTTAGLFAHGRGEAFNYLLGEQTIPAAREAMKAAVAMLLLARAPVLSVNGNVAALVPHDLVALAGELDARIEVNLFYREEGREEAIETVLREAGATEILGLGDVEPATLNDLESNRRIVDPRGIAKADVVMVPLEDGDRTEALRKAGKKIITIDLNPLSRTAQWAHVTICDEITRCLPQMIDTAREFKQSMNEEQLKELLSEYDNAKVLSKVISFMRDYLGRLAEQGVFLDLPMEGDD
ncbi:phosphopantothenate/pantothenate synthetase [Candidatus Bathyarchaeota archaeon]|nr:phosphopantothenate/pantothenate synthetase [Candidatus Bathyarchaeota archaeon]